jgi:hypothetical protein
MRVCALLTLLCCFMCASCRLAAPQELLDFWTNLRNAEVANSVLTLSEGTFFLGDPDKMNCLYVRAHYRLLYDEVCTLTAPQARRRKSKVVITGTPGIGKSQFAYYMMWRLSQKETTIIFQLGDDFYRFSGDDVVVGTKDLFVNAGYFMHKVSFVVIQLTGDQVGSSFSLFWCVLLIA